MTSSLPLSQPQWNSAPPAVTSHPCAVTSHPQVVTPHSCAVTSHSCAVTPHARAVTSHPRTVPPGSQPQGQDWAYSPEKPVTNCLFQAPSVPAVAGSSCRFQSAQDDAFEDVPEEEISEDEETEDVYAQSMATPLPDDDVTSKLLKFADNLNKDIQRYFGVKATDGCDIYEEKWTSGKSGRELYYAELLKVAQGIDTTDSHSQANSQTKSEQDTCNTAHSGLRNSAEGLGPLEELFKGAQSRPKPCVDGKMTQDSDNSSRKDCKKLPLTKRKLPQSFWEEPSMKVNKVEEQTA